MIETKSWKIKANQEDDFLDIWPYFGWTVKSNSDYESEWGGKAVKVTCTRDTTMPNYRRLKELGETYESVAFREPTPFMAFVAVCLTLCWVLPGIIYIAVTTTKRNKWKKKMETIANPALEEAKKLAGEW